MRELIFLRPGVLEWREKPDPKIQHPQDAIVRPISATPCDLDQLIIRGQAPFKGPFAIGHEAVAEVVEVGAEVVGFSPGQQVVVSWHISCGTCHRCRRDLPNTCDTHPFGAMYGLPIGGEWGGLFSDLVRVPFASTALTLLPEGLDPTHLASLSDNLPFGHEMTVPHLTREPGAPVLIMGGCGSIALYAAAFAVAAGSSRVDYVDTDPDRLALAETLGAHAVERSDRRRYGSYPIVVDASADASALVAAIRSTEPEGMCSSVGGHFTDVPLPMLEMYARGVRFYTGRGRGRPNIPAALDYVLDGRVRPELITSEVAAFDDAPAVLAEPTMKPMLCRAPISRTDAGLTPGASPS